MFTPVNSKNPFFGGGQPWVGVLARGAGAGGLETAQFGVLLEKTKDKSETPHRWAAEPSIYDSKATRRDSGKIRHRQ